MIINSIKLKNFRNYQNLEANFYKGINFLYGDNASGKTSIAESIYYLSIARSFRTTNDDELINSESKFATIKANLEVGQNKKVLDVYLCPEGKKIALNKKQVKKVSELADVTNCLYFVPEDVSLLKGLPKDRRLFLNIAISKLSKTYLEHISNYEKLLKERNNYLKENVVNYELINVLTEQMVKIEKEIYLYRSDYINKLNEKINSLYKKITQDNEKIKIIYEPFVKDEKNYESIALQEYKSCLNQDVKHKVTSKGVHKEDFYITKNNKNVGIYGSQGENRLAVLVLKLTPYELIDDYKSKPIVILDDVLSELDPRHKENLINYLSKLSQVFITSTQKIDIEKIHYFHINNGTLKEEE